MRNSNWLAIAGLLLFSLPLWMDSAAAPPIDNTNTMDLRAGVAKSPAKQSMDTQVYLPIVMTQRRMPRRVNVPYFNVSNVIKDRFSETAIFWFGKVNQTDNYADVRVGYNDYGLDVYMAAFDRRLWYDTNPTSADLTAWDAVTLYLSRGGNSSGVLGTGDYRFVAQLNAWEQRNDFQFVYQGNSSGWVAATVPFSTTSGWRGNAPNDDIDDRGWAMTFHIPFASVGLAGRPPDGTLWGLALALHDRDDAAGEPIPDKVWPESMDANNPYTWGQLAFGLPTYPPPSATSYQTITIRHKLNGAVIADGAVGGTTGHLCPGDPDFVWNHWGDSNFAGAPDFNIQNQSDVSDWPCFSKYYITFPLDAVPPGKVIISASLTLYQWGGSGAPGEAQPSLIQVLTVADNWDKATLTWNNAPLASENVSQAWVDPLSTYPGWPGVPRTWDVSRAVAQVYASAQPLRLALYSADSDYHSGKYFVSSDTEDLNAGGRPTLQVVWGDP